MYSTAYTLCALRSTNCRIPGPNPPSFPGIHLEQPSMRSCPKQTRYAVLRTCHFYAQHASSHTPRQPETSDLDMSHIRVRATATAVPECGRIKAKYITPGTPSRGSLSHSLTSQPGDQLHQQLHPNFQLFRPVFPEQADILPLGPSMTLPASPACQLISFSISGKSWRPNPPDSRRYGRVTRCASPIVRPPSANRMPL